MYLSVCTKNYCRLLSNNFFHPLDHTHIYFKYGEIPNVKIKCRAKKLKKENSTSSYF